MSRKANQSDSIKKYPAERISGVAVPLGALRTKESPAIGEYTSLVAFAGFCKKAGLRLIQLLPVLDTGTQNSPYSSLSAFALHPMYISLPLTPAFDACYRQDKAFAAEYDAFVERNRQKVRYDYTDINETKDRLLRTLYATKETQAELTGSAFAAWQKANPWIGTYCVYKHLKYTYMQASWKEWKKADRTMSKAEIANRWQDTSLKEAHNFYAWEQFEAWKQFKHAADEVRKAGIILKGDLPILLNEDSCDVWSDTVLFNQKLRAGSPPDGSNPGGQNWGFPTYNWKAHEADGFAWWRLRLTCAEQFYGAYRLDHVLGFFRIWAVPDGEGSAELGHTEPYSAISEAALAKAGFSGDRLTWLSEPHIPTGALGIENWDEARRVLSLFCARVKTEELWRFRSDIKTAADVWNVHIPGTDEGTAHHVKQTLSGWLHNRTLIELKKGSYVPLWQYSGTQAWQSLSWEEKQRLEELINENAKKNEKAWEKQADTIFSALIPATSMIPCGEDLGVNLHCLPAMLQKYGILGLEVLRWSRRWQEEGQPYIPMSEQRELALVTTSVHDSSTLRQWWQEEHDAARAFELTFTPASAEAASRPLLTDSAFSPEACQFVLSQAASTRSIWFVPPLQDWLYLDKRYWYDDAADERVNVPGTVSGHNWSYRMKESVEALTADTALTAKIKAIAALHD
ncbi:MAG: 4-alpha-glucanotransferase [Treponema sp.]|nr:4-alpha-glucanotransferase [Treponema sp.]